MVRLPQQLHQSIDDYHELGALLRSMIEANGAGDVGAEMAQLLKLTQWVGRRLEHIQNGRQNGKAGG